jgi:poly(3-hydroxybutyrate) depolymerase
MIGLVAGLLACTGVPCATVEDGTCDELASCALGTDAVDCEAACLGTRGDDPVCAHALARVAVDTPVPAEAGSGGSGGPSGTWDGTVVTRGTYSFDEVVRHFRVYAPRSLPPDRAVPVVFALGGFSVDAYWMAEFTELDRFADLNDLIVVYGDPEYRDFGSDWIYSWYVYEGAHTGDWGDNPDLEYLDRVLEEVAALYNVDRSQVFATGHSRGAALSIIAAAERPDLIAGFCAQAGFVEANDYDLRLAELFADDPAFRLRGVLVHGEEDPDVSIGNSDDLVALLEEHGHLVGTDLEYHRLERTGHEWQPQYNQQVLDFLRGRDGW